MEANGKIRGKYQKHKTDYKIVVSYKLNKKLGIGGSKDKTDPEYQSCPLYIEIRAKRQSAFVSSFLYLYTTQYHFEDFINQPGLKKIIEKETKEIIESLTAFIEDRGEEFKIYDWYAQYKENVFNSGSLEQTILKLFIFKLEALLQKSGVDIANFDKLCSNSNGRLDLDKCLALSKILESLDIKGFKKFFELDLPFIENIWYKLLLVTYRGIGPYNSNPDEVLVKDIGHYFKIPDLKSGIFREVVVELLGLKHGDPLYQILLDYESYVLTHLSKDTV